MLSLPTVLSVCTVSLPPTVMNQFVQKLDSRYDKSKKPGTGTTVKRTRVAGWTLIITRFEVIETHFSRPPTHTCTRTLIRLSVIATKIHYCLPLQVSPPPLSLPLAFPSGWLTPPIRSPPPYQECVWVTPLWTAIPWTAIPLPLVSVRGHELCSLSTVTVQDVPGA